MVCAILFMYTFSNQGWFIVGLTLGLLGERLGALRARLPGRVRRASVFDC